jgi:hypothetical protein
MPRQQPSRRARRTTGSPRLCGSHAARGRRHPPHYCFPDGIGRAPQAKSDRPGLADRAIASRGKGSRSAGQPHYPIRFERRDPAAIGLPRLRWSRRLGDRDCRRPPNCVLPTTGGWCQTTADSRRRASLNERSGLPAWLRKRGPQAAPSLQRTRRGASRRDREPAAPRGSGQEMGDSREAFRRTEVSGRPARDIHRTPPAAQHFAERDRLKRAALRPYRACAAPGGAAVDRQARGRATNCALAAIRPMA